VVPGDYREAAMEPDGSANENLRTQFLKIIRRAGLRSWPRLFHNLRASRETDLMKTFPTHVVYARIGNTPKIALGHYLPTLETDFEKAVKGGAESGAVRSRLGRTGVDNRAGRPGERGFRAADAHSRQLLSKRSDGQGGT
jgi:hypothetical protein